MRKYCLHIFLSLLIFTLNVAAISQTTFEKIERDFVEGRISKMERILHRAYAQFTPEQLTSRYQTENHLPEKCGTTIASDLRQNIDHLEANELDIFAKVLYRPSSTFLDKQYITLEGNFKLHYTTRAGPPSFPPTAWDQVPLDDADNNGIPDFVEETGKAFEYSRKLFIETLGYRDYPSDGDEYDVYLMDLRNGNYGGNIGESSVDSTEWGDMTSYIQIDNAFEGSSYYTTGLDAMRVTAAHELFHAFQRGYHEPTNVKFYMELTAVWMEEKVYPEVDDYIYYLYPLFNNFDKPLTSINYKYGNGIFANFLSNEYGDELLRKTFENFEIEGRGARFSEIVLTIEEELSTPFVDILNKYHTWNYYTGDRAMPGFGYDDTALFPELRFLNSLYFSDKEADFAFPIDTSLSINANRLSGNFYQISTDFPTQLSVKATSALTENPMWDGALFSKTDHSTLLFSSDSSGAGSISNSSSVSDFTLLITNGSLHYGPVSGGRFLLDLDISLSEAIDNIGEKVLRPTNPNPVNFSIQNEVVIPFFLEKASKIDMNVYSLSGRKVKRFVQKSFERGMHKSVIWDGVSDSGEPVGSGIYICVIKGNDFSDTMKMAVIR